ncbi:MAG TPA: DsrE family protein [Ideonella sp.]|uniref:DsrE family protein n=1 Tax=Ideonella sp. TaxID=1929293 RepID=UPI002C899C78|nr:DsrE family protein [Ideonella sp.]HSI50260.1 DsrE family protein [Ideonella sp.]
MQVATSPVVTTPVPPMYRVLERRHCTVILVTGADDGGMRATLAFTAAFTAASMEQPTLVFLAGDGAHWGYEGRADGVRMSGFPALADLIESFVEAGGQIGLCPPCDGARSLPAGGSAQPLARLPGVRLQGMPSVLAHSADGSALTF